MNIKILGAQVLILALMIVMGSIIFVDSLENVYAILMPSIVLVAIAGYYLIHSVQLEVQQREKLEILSTQLSAANAKLTELDTLKSQFLSFASHQLRTPLTAIKWQSQLLRDGTVGTLPEKALEIARGIEDSTQRMLELVSEFLNLRKLEEGKMEYSFEPTDVVELTSHIVEDIRPLASHKSLELTFTTHATTSLCSVDRQKFTQVIQNLVDNAIKYTDRGYVRVVVDNPQSKQIRIAVTDSGHGIDPTVISSLFEQFVRDKKDAKTIEGTGLGLYIAKQMIDAHKGTISASSDGKGKGSTFAVQLPTL